MKETYFTFENIDQISRDMINQLKEKVRIKELTFIPEKSALLVLDMQEYFLNENSHAFVPSSQAIIPKINLLIQAYNNANLPVIFTKHLNTNENADLMGVWWKDIIRKDNDLSKISENLNTKNSIIIEKTQYDAFYNTNLLDILKDKNIHQIVITGVMTHLCCETTARSAFTRGIVPILPVDTTATYNRDFHYATFLNLSHGFTTSTLSEEILLKIEKYNYAKS